MKLLFLGDKILPIIKNEEEYVRPGGSQFNQNF